MDTLEPTRIARPTFIVLAWLSPILPVAAILGFWTIVASLPREPRSKGIAEWLMVGAFSTCFLSFASAVASLFGIRNSRAAAVIVPGAAIGMLLSLAGGLLMGVYFTLANMKF